MEVKVQLTPLTITEITEKQQVMRRASSASSEALCSIDLNSKVNGDEGRQNGGGVGEATKAANEGENKVLLASGQRKRRKAPTPSPPPETADDDDDIEVTFREDKVLNGVKATLSDKEKCMSEDGTSSPRSKEHTPPLEDSSNETKSKGDEAKRSKMSHSDGQSTLDKWLVQTPPVEASSKEVKSKGDEAKKSKKNRSESSSPQSNSSDSKAKEQPRKTRHSTGGGKDMDKKNRELKALLAHSHMKW